MIAEASGFFRFYERNYNQRINVTAALETTIAWLEAQAPDTVGVGETITLRGWAVDHYGRVMLLPAGALLWSIAQGAGFATLTPDGKLTGTAPGTVRVRLSEVDDQVQPLEFDMEVVSG